MKISFFLVLCLNFVFLSACSQINPDAQQAYQEKKIRHGIVPHELMSNKNSSVKVAEKTNPGSIKRGEKIYSQHCITCHGVAGDGVGAVMHDPQRPAANLRKTVNEVENFDFFVSVSYWKNNMPGWKNLLSDQDKSDLVSYIKTFRN